MVSDFSLVHIYYYVSLTLCHLLQSDNVASPRSPSSSKPYLVCVEQSEHSDEGYNSPQIPVRYAIFSFNYCMIPNTHKVCCNRKKLLYPRAK